MDLNPNRRGFAPGIPGCMIHYNIVNAVLQDAKRRKGDCVVAFLDTSKAFDNVGHDHIAQSLESMGIFQNLLALILNLLVDNSTFLMIENKKSKPIPINKGVP